MLRDSHPIAHASLEAPHHDGGEAEGAPRADSSQEEGHDGGQHEGRGHQWVAEGDDRPQRGGRAPGDEAVDAAAGVHGCSSGGGREGQAHEAQGPLGGAGRWRGLQHVLAPPT